MRRTGFVALAALIPSGAVAQSLVNGHGIPPQIVPLFQERGAPSFTPAPEASGAGVGGSGGGITLQDPGASGASISAPAGSALAALQATSFGDAAQVATQQAGISVESLAGIGQIESGFRNLPTANGTSSATGPWQITTGTWNGTVARYGLGYSTADINNPAAQATVASYIIRDTAQTISAQTGQPATTLDVYGGYVFGTQNGARIASEAELHRSAERHRPRILSREQRNAELDRRRFSESDGCEVGISREPGCAGDPSMRKWLTMSAVFPRSVLHRPLVTLCAEHRAGNSIGQRGHSLVSFVPRLPRIGGIDDNPNGGPSFAARDRALDVCFIRETVVWQQPTVCIDCAPRRDRGDVSAHDFRPFVFLSSTRNARVLAEASAARAAARGDWTTGRRVR